MSTDVHVCFPARSVGRRPCERQPTMVNTSVRRVISSTRRLDGGTDALGFSNAIRVATRLIADRGNQGIKDDFLYLAGQIPKDPRIATG